MIKKVSKTKAKPVSKGKKALAELKKITESARQLEKQADLQAVMKVRIFNQAEVNELFILDEIQSVPYIRGREKKKNGVPIILIKAEKKRGRDDLFYIFKKGREAYRLSDRYSTVPQKAEETIREKIDQAEVKREKLTVSERYGKSNKKLSKKEVIKKRYG